MDPVVLVYQRIDCTKCISGIHNISDKYKLVKYVHVKYFVKILILRIFNRQAHFCAIFSHKETLCFQFSFLNIFY